MNRFTNKRTLAKIAIFFGIILLLFSGIIFLNRMLLKNVEDKIDYDCVDFSYQEDAQEYFISQSGTSTKNVDNLDSDNNGVACESLDKTPTLNFLKDYDPSVSSDADPTLEDLANGRGRINQACLAPSGEFDLDTYIQASDSGIECASY